ncbi:hypothetical protein BCY91_01875 [Pelobium manganitolerans]|uniref:Pectate lyase domain-containing protein n=1 Tax=Pelobium manganitolerans TaxID=1842495 RepID=A0A419SC58_9SPHI|nr:T9SS type A sorting domain-containing protein [Pelobium manganitolerans]RKD20389.1 hypothetical protein BCY91_01875 [Pelobium manganitolerans]
MKAFLNGLGTLCLFFCISYNVKAQTTLINTQFTESALPAFVSSDGTINTTKAADGICSKGMIQVNKGQFIELDVASCSSLIMNMKSTSENSARTVNVKYKIGTVTDYNNVAMPLTVQLAASFNLTDIYPELISSENISIRLEPANGNIQVHDLVLLSKGLSSGNAITSFKMNGQVGDELVDANNHTVSINVLAGTPLANVAPHSIGISPFASVSPQATAPQNFALGNPVVYKVTGENGDFLNWTVIVSEVSSAQKEITDFKLKKSQLGKSIIDASSGAITVNVPDTAKLDDIVPYYIYTSDLTSVSPAITATQDFNNPVVYTVTAADNSTKTWTITVNKIDINGFPGLDLSQVVGFASVSADGFTGPTTGGAAQITGRTNDTVYINGPDEFAKFCTILKERIKYKTYSNNPLTIVLEPGTYTGAGGTESVWANQMLTIQEQENLTIIGRRNVVLNFGINVKRSSNIVIRNLNIRDYYDDGINIGEPETHHVWVDHCTVGHPLNMPADPEHPDGGIDVKNGASYVTISWTKYQNSYKTGLVGHSDSNGATDNGRLKVTYYANHFFHTNSRNPRVRFGEVHVLNNLEEQVQLYGIAAANGSSVYAENNFFLNTRWPMYADRTTTDFKALYGYGSDATFSSKTGNYPALGLKQVGNAYDDGGLPAITAQINAAMLNPGGRSVKFDELNPEAVFNPSSYYTYTAMDANVVRKIVPLLAGADVIDFFPKASTATTLPLTLLAFDAIVQDRLNPKVRLTWTTTNEYNTQDFEVLRKSDEGNFEKIAIVPAKNTAGEFTYSAIDDKPFLGSNYYQLKQNDKNGKYSLSKTVAVSFKPKTNLKLYPNPATSVVKVTHPAALTSGTITLVSADGKVVAVHKIATNSNETSISLDGLTPGFYTLLFNQGAEHVASKFIVQ